MPDFKFASGIIICLRTDNHTLKESRKEGNKKGRAEKETRVKKSKGLVYVPVHVGFR